MLILLLFSFQIFSISSDVVTDVEDSVMDAIELITKLQNRQKSNFESKMSPDSQKPNEESKMMQSNAEIFEEATQILVKKYGLDIIPIANKIADTWKNGSGPEDVREKRNVDCDTTPKSCKDPFHQSTRSITGLCNNLKNEQLGNSATATRRLLGASSYSDGLNRIRSRGQSGKQLPSAREISNKIHDSDNHETLSNTYNHLLMQMGQFLAHDIIFMPSSVGSNGASLNCSSCDSPSTVSPNCAPIEVPSNDPYFKTKCIRLTRAMNGQKGFGVRQQINQNTHFIDLSVVYGSSNCESQSVREHKNGRLLEYSYANYVLPPQNTKNDENCQSKRPTFCFICGDFRNSLHPALIPIHVIFIKQHNRLAKMIVDKRPDWPDEQIFQTARKILISQWQHFVFSEYLPIVLPFSIRRKYDLVGLSNGFFRGYDDQIDPSLTNEFAGAAFRFGHSQVRDRFRRINGNGVYQGDYKLGNDIFYADQMYLSGNGGWESVLIGMIRSESLESDRKFSFSMRNEMFKTRGEHGSGVDMAAINIMRGRDIGLLPYFSYRTFSGLTSNIKFWSDLRSEFSQENINLLRNVYENFEDIDLYTGILTETHMDGSIIGPTGANIIGEAFNALKIGDRFFYENEGVFTENQLNEIRKSTLAKMICENTNGLKTINNQIFNILSRTSKCEQITDLNITLFL